VEIVRPVLDGCAELGWKRRRGGKKKRRDKRVKREIEYLYRKGGGQPAEETITGGNPSFQGIGGKTKAGFDGASRNDRGRRKLKNGLDTSTMYPTQSSKEKKKGRRQEKEGGEKTQQRR